MSESAQPSAGCATYSLMCLAHMFRRFLQPGTLLLLGAVSVFTLASLVLPSWVVQDSKNDHYFGLFDLSVAAEYLNNLSCKRSGEDVRDRVDSVAALLIVGSVFLGIFTLALVWKSVFRTWFTKCGRMTMYIFGGLAALLYAVSLIVFDATFNSWYLCGKTYCDFLKHPNCGLDYSWYVMLVAVLATIGVTIGVHIAERFPTRREETKTILMLASIVCFIMAVYATVQPHWMKWDVRTNSTRTEWGIFFSCTGMGGDCATNTYPPGEFSPRAGCKREWSALGARYKTTAAFLILSLIVVVGLFIFLFLNFCQCVSTDLTKQRKYSVASLLGFAVLSQFIALVVFYNTMDSWYMCGEHFCYDKPSCGFGLGYILGVLSILTLSFVLIAFTLHTFELFCYNPHASDDDPFAVAHLDRDDADIQLANINAEV